MKDGHRVLRVEKELQHIVADYIVRRVSFGGGLVAVSRVESTKELRTAKLYISVMGSEEQKERAMEILQDFLPDIQKHVNREMRMKFVPRLSLHLDRGLEHMMHVQDTLSEIESRDAERAGVDSAGDSTGDDSENNE